MKRLLTFLLIVFTMSCSQKPERKFVAPSPPMGWNSWNWFGKEEINEEKMKQCMDAIVEYGLLDAGYQYFVIDGGWRDTVLTVEGGLKPHPERFPNGMKVLADYAHARGLKFGLHTVPGTHDCGKAPVGGYGREELHVQQLIDWGVDFIKLDKCKFKDGWDEGTIKATYFKWREILNEKEADNILLSISAYKYRDWNPLVGEMARTTGDIGARITGIKSGFAAIFDTIPIKKRWPLTVMEIAEINNQSASYAGDGFWNDPDMMVTGNQGLTLNEQKSHFALWCIMSAPLFLGNNPLEMDEDELNIILNDDAIAVDQDPTGQGERVYQENDAEIWMKKMLNGEVAVLLLNRDKTNEKDIRLSLRTLRLEGTQKVKDIFGKKYLGIISGENSYRVKPGASLFLLLSKN